MLVTYDQIMVSLKKEEHYVPLRFELLGFVAMSEEVKEL